MATNDFENSPVSTDVLIQACKTFIALGTGGIQNHPLMSFAQDSCTLPLSYNQ